MIKAKYVHRLSDKGTKDALRDIILWLDFMEGKEDFKFGNWQVALENFLIENGKTQGRK